MQRFRHAMIPAAVLAAALAGAPAWAQGTGAGAAPAPAPTVTQPTEDELVQYVSAAQKVAVVAESYRPKVMAATDDTSRQELLSQADDEMVRAVQGDGMTVDEYNGISQAIQQDPELQQRVVAMVNAQGGAPMR